MWAARTAEPEELVEVTAFAELEEEEQVALVLVVLVELHHVSAPRGAEHFGFSAEEAFVLAAVLERLVEHLQRVALAVEGPHELEDLAERASAQEALHDVLAFERRAPQQARRDASVWRGE